MLSGEQLFVAENSFATMYKQVEEQPQPLRSLRREIPETLESLVLSLLAKEPDSRPDSADEVYARLMMHVPGPGGTAGSSDDLPMDPTRPFRRPFAPRTPSRAAATSLHEPIDVGEYRRRAAALVEEGRFTQAAGLLDVALRQEARTGDAPGLRLEYASALILGGEFLRALPEYEDLIAEYGFGPHADAEIVLHCREQAAVCRVELGDVTEALAEFRVLLEERRDAEPVELFELRRQIGLLEASTGDLTGALRTLDHLRLDVARLAGEQHPDVVELQDIVARLKSITESSE
jgi:tetratricopeptide (TPR) repeat protein